MKTSCIHDGTWHNCFFFSQVCITELMRSGRSLSPHWVSTLWSLIFVTQYKVEQLIHFPVVQRKLKTHQQSHLFMPYKKFIRGKERNVPSPVCLVLSHHDFPGVCSSTRDQRTHQGNYYPERGIQKKSNEWRVRSEVGYWCLPFFWVIKFSTTCSLFSPKRWECSGVLLLVCIINASFPLYSNTLCECKFLEGLFCVQGGLCSCR